VNEVRAALAIARKDLLTLSRYKWSMFGMVFTPLYQGVIPAFLFGTAFAVGGRVVGLDSAIGTDNLSGFIFMGGVMAGLISTAFWFIAMSLRWEMDMGTLEPTWLTPTSHDTILIGRMLQGLVVFVAGQVILFAVGIAFFDLRFSGDILFALPAMLIAVVARTCAATIAATATSGVLMVTRIAANV